ncbi:uncharacterized protein [Mycetomoellerius zeteki]|uniref:uncharacterized protein n=1 Tax=Mycetomoellerius zeteki TaxID=64791 RepID=UPI00084E5FB1|nr:PREDICTED: uncharacterized protein LOC108725329 [Trachymyrmex zeteki]
MEEIVVSLSRLLPNLGGAGSTARRLYANVVASVTLYGAPVWASEAEDNAVIQRTFRASQRRLACRKIRAYKTSYILVVSTALADMPPLELMTGVHSEVHERVSEARREGEILTPSIVRGFRENARRKLIVKWKDWMSGPARDQALAAIRPRLVK